MASQTITGKDLQFTQDNKHAFAYSGSVDVANSTITLLKFTSGSGYIVGTFQPQYFDNAGAENFQFKVLFNSIQVAGCVLDKIEGYTPYEEIEIIIPPFTDVEITALNVADADTRKMAAIIIGRVYEYLSVRN